jgi:ketosteroid isomerase-like protein
MDVAEHIIALERSALDRWIRADPDGYLDLSVDDATYFDPFREMRADTRGELSAIATQVYRQLNGAWRIAHTHWSFTQPQLASPAGI